MNFYDISYLRDGTPRQIVAYDDLIGHGIMTKLAAYQPLLVGTIPINIDIEGSDLDVICCWNSQDAFTRDLIVHFGSYPGFSMRELLIAQQPSVVANFHTEHFEVEVFGQNVATPEQMGYRHMMVEHQVLMKYGEAFRLKVIELKRQGLKTEPAFAELLGVSGDVYQALLEYPTT